MVHANYKRKKLSDCNLIKYKLANTGFDFLYTFGPENEFLIRLVLG